MSVTMSVTIDPTTPAGVKLYAALGALLAGKHAAVEITDDGEDETPAPKKRGRPPKVKATEPEDDEPEADEEDEDESEDEEPEPVKARPRAKKGTGLSDVIAAFKDFADANGRPAAKKVLTKFKVDSVRDLPEDKYDAVLKLLN